MRQTGSCSKWVFVLYVPFIVLLLTHSPVHGTWNVVESICGIVEAVHFTSANEGWAVGYNVLDSDAYHYQNGTWTHPSIPSDYLSQLYGVHFTSANEGWAVGSSRRLLHYQNGTWTSVSPPAVSDSWYLTGVHFTSADEGWAVGHDVTNRNGALLHYQNGIWTAVTFPPGSSRLTWWLNKIHFTSANEGWAVGAMRENFPGGYYNDYGVLLHYQNGIWTQVTPPDPGNWPLGGVHFTSANEGWAVGEDTWNHRGVLLHYQNGTWTSVTPPAVPDEWLLNGVHFTSADEGWAVGGDKTDWKGLLLHYQNGTWTSETTPDLGGGRSELSSVHFTSANEGWAVGRCNGGRWYSKLGGCNGQYRTLFFNYIGQAATPVSPKVGESVPAGALYPIEWKTVSRANSFNVSYSLDNGLTWTPIQVASGGTKNTGVEGFVTGTSVNWAVPLLTKNKTKCLIKITAFDASNKKLGTDKSDAPFTIEVLSLTSPSPGTTCTSGQPCRIEWTKAPAVDAVSGVLSYSVDNGTTWKNIPATISGTDTFYDWTPSATSTKKNCKVKLVLKDASGNKVASDVSDGVFTINP